MRYIILFLFFLSLYGCEINQDNPYNDVFFYPCECNESPIDNGFIKVYNDIDTSGSPHSFVDYVPIDSEYAINDQTNGLYYSYHTSLKIGTYYAEVYSDITEKSQVHEFKIEHGTNYITLLACE
jgi:hypothetical protein